MGQHAAGEVFLNQKHGVVPRLHAVDDGEVGMGQRGHRARFVLEAHDRIRRDTR